jgi:hypothetical protein
MANKKNVEQDKSNTNPFTDDLDFMVDEEVDYDAGDEILDEDDDESNEMLYILELIFDAVTDFYTHDIDPILIESMLFTCWIQTVVLGSDEDEEFMNAQLDKMDELIPATLKQLSAIYGKLPAAEMDENVDNTLLFELQKMISAAKSGSAVQLNDDEQQDIVEEKTTELFETFEKMNAHPMDVEAAFLYYWVLLMAFNNPQPKEYLAKLSHYWGDIFEQMAIFIRNEMGIKDSFE